jgi:hypothetical protein
MLYTDCGSTVGYLHPAFGSQVDNDLEVINRATHEMGHVSLALDFRSP